MKSDELKNWSIADLLLLGADLEMDARLTSPDIHFQTVVPVEQNAPDGLAIASNPEQIQIALKIPKALVVVPLQALAHPALQTSLKKLVGCKNPGVLWARALATFHPHGTEKRPSNTRHVSAIIDPSAHIDPSAIIEAYAVVGARVRIDAGVWVGPHCVIEEDALIGENSRLQANVYIGPRTQIGKRVQIKPQSVIGGSGFGLSHDENGKHFAVPQVGCVVLADEVMIGSMCTIDRATFGQTIIGEGTKMDNQVHIGHNCKIGKHTILTGRVSVSGSSEIGDHCLLGGSTVVTDHVTIASHVQLGGLSAVSKNVTEAGAYGGHPLQRIKDALRSTASIARLPSLRKDVALIMKHLGLKENL